MEVVFAEKEMVSLFLYCYRALECHGNLIHGNALISIYTG